MSNGRLIYIDEDADDIVYFQQFVDGHFNVDVIHIENDAVLEEVVDEIMNTPPDAVITDFMLNEKARVAFNGQALIDSLQERNRHLPCFLLTSHPPDAIEATHDARIVQAKAVMMGENDELGKLFRSQIAKIIIDHKVKLAQAEEELDRLVSMPAETRTAQDRERIIQLDRYIEEHGVGVKVLPDEIKDEKSIELLTKLVSRVDELLGKK
jgi:DNA-binding NarL/FixJ family response regulator